MLGTLQGLEGMISANPQLPAITFPKALVKLAR
jgi:hypothetical protein